MNTTKALEMFTSYLLKERGRNQRTVKIYSSYISKFISITSVESTSDITVEHIKKFKQELLDKKLSKKSVNYYLIALRVFVKFLDRNDIPTISVNKIELFYKSPDKKIELISQDELKQFLSVKVSPRSDLLANLLYGTGLRIHELQTLNIKDIKFNTCNFTVIGKGGKERLVFLPENVCRSLQSFIGTRKSGPIFTDENDKPLTIMTLQRDIARRADYVKLSHKVTPHTLRHLYASSLLANGADIRSIQQLLGHSSITTTQRYTHISDKQLHDTFKKYHVSLQ